MRSPVYLCGRDIFRDDHVAVRAADAAQNNSSRRYRRSQNHVPDRVHHMKNHILRNRLGQPDTGNGEHASTYQYRTGNRSRRGGQLSFSISASISQPFGHTIQVNFLFIVLLLKPPVRRSRPVSQRVPETESFLRGLPFSLFSRLLRVRSAVQLCDTRASVSVHGATN